MGVINVTDDSFYSGSRYMALTDAVSVALRMASEGADIIDIGGCSTRPGSAGLSPEEEKSRVIPAIKAVRKELPEAIISVDTYRSQVAAEAILDAGASIINDISGGDMDHHMPGLVTRLNVPYIMMHMQGNPLNMQKNPVYDDVISDIVQWFGKRVPFFLEAGLKDLIIDPGIGFGKTAGHNFEIIDRLREFSVIGMPVMIGLSRKSVIWRTLGTDPSGALNGTTALNMAALMNGADILRVHDVKEAVETVRLFENLKKSRREHE